MISPEIGLETNIIENHENSSTVMNINIYLADQNPHRDRTIGVTTYTKGILKGLLNREAVKIYQISTRSSYMFKEQQFTGIVLPWRSDNRILRLFTDNMHPYFVNNIKPDVWFYPKGYLPRFFVHKQPVIGTVHDTIIQHYADNYPNERSQLDYKYWLSAMRHSIKNFDHIITVSQTARKQIENFCFRYDITPPGITVSYETVCLPTDIKYGHGKKDYICHFASKAPHKKTEKVIQLWLDFVKNNKKNAPAYLYLLGRGASEFRKYENTGLVKCAKNMDHTTIYETIGSSRALIMGSEIEGFGLPVLEAYLVRTPACFIKDTACHEIVSPYTNKGSFSLYGEPSFDSALKEVLTMSEGEVSEISFNLQKAYSMEAVSAKIVECFEKVLTTRS